MARSRIFKCDRFGAYKTVHSPEVGGMHSQSRCLEKSVSMRFVEFVLRYTDLGVETLK